MIPLEQPTSNDSRIVLPSDWQPPPLVLFDSVASAHKAAVESFSPDRIENLPLMANPETLFLVAERHLKPIIEMTLQRRTTPYVHGQILLATPGPLQSELWPDPTFLKTLQHRVISLDVELLSFTEFLAAFHNLVALLLALILQWSPKHSTLPTVLLNLWHKWRQHLSTTMPHTLSSDLSAWEAWYTAESARRSLLCVILVDGMLELAEKGYCSYRPMVESLPFDARTGLWEAETEEQWRVAVSSHGGIQSSLMSWSEFIEGGDLAPRKEYDGMLQRMLLVIHFGKAGIELQDKM
jgi:hypothetical protein